MTSGHSDQDFDADSLVAQAVAEAGYGDFGSLPYREGLEVLLETYARHVADPAGRKRCRARVLKLLATRLRCEHAFRQIPDDELQPITAPIFVTGLPRSGTSALLNLLAAVPDNRGLLQWEVQFPDPWPGAQPGEEDPRYRPLVGGLAAPSNAAFRKIHYVDADTPEECVMLHALAFSGVQLGFEIMLEPYRSWLLAQDLAPMYAYQYKLLQMQAWRTPGPGRRWLLKAPAHMLGIDSILKVFPDARFIWCHRHPLQVVPSVNSMNQSVMRMYAGDCSHLDPHKVGRDVMEWYAMTLERGLAERARLPADRFVDCSQDEIVSRPLALVERAYQAFDLPRRGDYLTAVQAHVDANPKGKHGVHEYDLASYGLSELDVHQRFGFYVGNGQWPLSL